MLALGRKQHCVEQDRSPLAKPHNYPAGMGI